MGLNESCCQSVRLRRVVVAAPTPGTASVDDKIVSSAVVDEQEASEEWSQPCCEEEDRKTHPRLHRTSS